MLAAQLMQDAIKASEPIPSSVTAPTLRESFKKALEILEDSPTEGLIELLRIISGAARKKNYFRIINCLKAHCINCLVTKQLIQF